MSISSHSQQIYQVVMGATKFDVDAIIVVLKQVLNITHYIHFVTAKYHNAIHMILNDSMITFSLWHVKLFTDLKGFLLVPFFDGFELFFSLLG